MKPLTIAPGQRFVGARNATLVEAGPNISEPFRTARVLTETWAREPALPCAGARPPPRASSGGGYVEVKAQHFSPAAVPRKNYKTEFLIWR